VKSVRHQVSPSAEYQTININRSARDEDQKDDIEMNIDVSKRQSRRGLNENQYTSVPTSPVKENTRGTTDIISKKANSGRFVGDNPLQYALLAHYMSYGSAMMCFYCGVFALLWTSAHHYHCKVDGKDIYSLYIESNGICANNFVLDFNQPMTLCCDPNGTTSLKGSVGIGSLYIVYTFVLIFLEDTLTPMGMGLYYPNDSFWYHHYSLFTSYLI
jgi:hypothetical protein